MTDQQREESLEHSGKDRDVRANRRRAGVVILLTAMLGALLTVVPSMPSAFAVNVGGSYTALQPDRITDTRPGSGEANAGSTLAAGATLTVSLPASVTNASAVVLNVTATNAAVPGFLTVFPEGTAPLASNVNFRPGEDVPNLVTVRIGAGNSVRILNGSGGNVDVVVDLEGFFLTPEATTGGAGHYNPLTPARITDTRAGSGQTNAGSRLSGSAIDVQVTGQGGVPATGVNAVALNVTAVGASTPGFLTAYPTGSSQPTASNVNFPADPGGVGTPNRVFVPVGTGGKVTIFSNASVDVIVDTSGWFSDNTGGPDEGSVFNAVTPARITDTRPGSGQTNAGSTIGPAGVLSVQVSGQGGVPAGATAGMLNVTEALNPPTGTPTAPSFMTVYPSDAATRPLASDLNFVPGQTKPNLVPARLGADGKVNIYNNAGNADVAVDVFGYFLPSADGTLPPTTTSSSSTTSSTVPDGGGSGVIATSAPDLVNAAIVPEPSDPAGSIVRACFDETITAIPGGPASFSIIGYDTADAIQPTAANIDVSDSKCVILSGFPGGPAAPNQVNEFTTLVVQTGAVNDIEVKPNVQDSAPLTGTLATAQPGDTTGPDLRSFTKNNTLNRITYCFDENLNPATVNAARFGFHITNGDAEFGTGVVLNSTAGKCTTIQFDGVPPVSDAVRVFAQFTAVTDLSPAPGNTNPENSLGGTTTDPDLTTVTKVTGNNTQFDFSFDQPVNLAPGGTGCFFVYEEDGAFFGGNGAVRVDADTFRVTFTAIQKFIDQIVLASVDVATCGGGGAVVSDDLVGDPNTHGSVGVLAPDVAAGNTDGPDAVSATKNTTTREVTVIFDENICDVVAGCGGGALDPTGFKLVTDNGTILGSVPTLVTLGGNSITLQYANVGDVNAAVGITIDGAPAPSPAGSITDFQGNPNPTASLDF